MAAYVHPTAIVGDNYKPAPFTLIDAEVVLGANVITGSFLHIRYGATIGDDVLVGDHVTIHDGTVVGAGSVLGDGARDRPTDRCPGPRGRGRRTRVGRGAGREVHRRRQRGDCRRSPTR